MSALFDPTFALSNFKLPPQDIQLLAFCKSNKVPKVMQWAEELRITQVGPTSAALYDALPQIAHLKTDAKSRFEMLEPLWSPTQQCAQALAKEFLQQPLILPAKAQKTALLAQALQKHLADGYLLCARELTQSKKLKSANRDILLNCLYRAVHASGQLLLRSYQLYTKAPPNTWARLHAIFQTAEYFELHTRAVPVVRTESGVARTLSDAYKRLLLLDSIRPNQISQYDIGCAYGALESWATQVKFLPSATDDEHNVYLVDLNQDVGAITKNRFQAEEYHRVLELDVKSLLSQLEKIAGKPVVETNSSGPGAPITRPPELSSTLMEHMMDCWKRIPERTDDRRRCDIEADACIGLIDCHFHLCGAIEFDQFINPRESMGDSMLSEGFGALISSLSSKKDIDDEKTPRKSIFPLTIQNISGGGYCILWQGDLPNRVEAGELIGLRERGRRAWSLGVIRWIRQLKNGSQLGIQLLTNQPVPYGAAIMYDMGGYSDYMRAIHIPVPAMADQPSTLLTASAPFQAQSRVKLKQEESDLDIRLTDCVFATSKIQLFDFDNLGNEDP